MIKLSGIDKHFGNFHVLKDINLHFAKGNIIALLGPNASGKTTLIKTVLGMVIPDKGTIEVEGQDIKNNWTYKSSIGYMPQIGRYPENMRIGQVLDMIMDLREGDASTLDYDLYEQFKLEEILDKRMNTLSGGTRQKVSAHLAFLFDPPVLILDEPTAGLDPLSSLILKEKIIKEKEKGKLIVITSHILSELDDVINQVIYIAEGSIILHESFDQLKENTGKDKLAEVIAHIMKQETINP